MVRKRRGGWWKKEGEYSDDATTQRVPSPPVQQESCSVKYCASRDDACSRRCTMRESE